MKAAEVHALKDAELIDAVRNAREEAFNLRLRHATGDLEDSAALGSTRRDLARLLTIARERGIDIQRELRKK